MNYCHSFLDKHIVGTSISFAPTVFIWLREAVCRNTVRNTAKLTVCSETVSDSAGLAGIKKARKLNAYGLSWDVIGHRYGTEDWSRTSTSERKLAPEASASTNSATPARERAS